MLGALGLQKLENMFRKIYNATRKAKELDDSQDSASNLFTMLNDYGFEVSNAQELQDLTNYLNNLTALFASLYSGYKNHLIFSEDKALELQNRTKFIKVRFLFYNKTK